MQSIMHTSVRHVRREAWKKIGIGLVARFTEKQILSAPLHNHDVWWWRWWCNLQINGGFWWAWNDNLLTMMPRNGLQRSSWQQPSGDRVSTNADLFFRGASSSAWYKLLIRYLLVCFGESVDGLVLGGSVISSSVRGYLSEQRTKNIFPFVQINNTFQHFLVWII